MKRFTGFTLVEVTVAGFMLMVVVTIGGAFWYYTRNSYQFSMTQYRLTENANRAVQRMALEIREAQDAMDGAYPLATLADNELVFYADTNNDGQVNRIHYWVNGTNVMRGVVTPSGNPPQYDLSTEKTTILAEQLSSNYSPLFTYYNGDWPGDTTHNPLAVAGRTLTTRMVGITLPLTIDDANGTSSFSAQTVIHIRNLKDNL